MAGEWEKALTDFDMFEEQMIQDSIDTDEQLEDAVLDDSSELFPSDEDEEEMMPEEYPYPDEEQFVTIKVDGVPVVLSDVSNSEWYATYIEDVASKNLISGYRDQQGRPTGKFGPSDSVTVEQLAKIATLTAQVDQFACGADLRNESAKGRWSERYIRCAEQLGWILFSEGTTDVTRPALRAEVVVTVLQAFQVRISPVSGTMFKDVSRATPYGNAIETAASEGVVSGYNDNDGNATGYFGGSDFVNRAEAAKIFSNAFSIYGN